MERELIEALIGERKRLEDKVKDLQCDINEVEGKEKDKIKKQINELDSKIRGLNTRISALKSPLQTNNWQI